MTNAKLQVAQHLAATLELVDTVTGSPITGATFSGVSISSDNTAIMEVVTNADNPEEQDIVGMAAGEANLSVTAIADFTDSNNEPASETVSAVIPVTVESTADGVALVVNFGPATLPPAAAGN